MQCIKQASTLRISDKKEKPSPRIVYRYGKKDDQIRGFLDYRKLIKRLMKKLETRQQTPQTSTWPRTFFFFGLLSSFWLRVVFLVGYKSRKTMKTNVDLWVFLVVYYPIFCILQPKNNGIIRMFLVFLYVCIVLVRLFLGAKP